MTRSRYLTAGQAVLRLDRMSFLERAAAHILAGWIVKTPVLEIKVEWGRQLASNMEHAYRLRERSTALRAGRDAEGSVPISWRRLAQSIDDSADANCVLRGVFDLKQQLFTHSADYLCRADPVADAASIRVVEAAHKTSSMQMKWMSRRLEARGPLPRPKAGAGASKSKGDEIPLDEALWAPVDRVPHVVRPPGMRRGEPGALRVLPLHPRSRKDTGLFLHNFLNEEFTTLELVSRNSYEHPEMPWAFHLDAARHSGDEARHAQLFTRALQDYGLVYGHYPVYTYSYEGEYEFPGVGDVGEAICPPGSRTELLWRILLRQVVHEGQALDSTAFEVRKRQHLHQPELARLFGFILADEIFHAGAGLKWSRYLVAGDEAELLRQRDLAYGYYADRLKDRRLTWGASHIEEAAAEAERLELIAKNYKLPFRSEVNVAARRRAGFLEQDILNLIDQEISVSNPTRKGRLE